MTCIECIFAPMCAGIAETTMEVVTQGKEASEVCHYFKNKADFVEAVRCEKCEHWGKTEISNGFRQCRKSVYLVFTRHDHFCSYGEHKKGR